jgi:hypothetical protein
MHMFSKAAVVAVAALATVGEARLHHRHEARSAVRANTTAPVMTTSTIYSSKIVTVTSCASSVKDCPSKSTVLSTSIIAVGTTVCPVDSHPKPSEGPKVVPSALSETGSKPTPSVVPEQKQPEGKKPEEKQPEGKKPLPSKPTSVSPAITETPMALVSQIAAANSSMESVARTASEGDLTLTYTLGSGSSTSVVTTTITKKSTLLQTSVRAVCSLHLPHSCD